MAFPQINSYGTISQRPYSESLRFKTLSSDLESGLRYTSYQHANPLWTIEVNYPAITADEVAVLEAFFAEMRGRYGEFEFTTDDSVVHAKCHFATDELEIRAVGPGQFAAKLRIEEYA
jgi:hypothetical protein